MTQATLGYDSAKYPNFKEYLWYISNENVLLSKYYGQYLVIKNEEVLGAFESRKAARLATLPKHEPGTYIIHHCVEEKQENAPRLYGRNLISVAN